MRVSGCQRGGGGPTPGGAHPTPRPLCPHPCGPASRSLEAISGLESGGRVFTVHVQGLLQLQVRPGVGGAVRGRGAVLGLQAARAGCRLAGSRALWVVTSTVGVCRRDSTPPSLWTMAPAQPSPSRAAPASPACSWAREGPTGRRAAAATLTPLPSGKPGVTAIKSPQPFLSPGRCGVVGAGVGEGGGSSSRGVASGHPWVRARAWPWRWSFRPSTLAAGVRPPRPLCLPGATFTSMTRTDVCSGAAWPCPWPGTTPPPAQGRSSLRG